MINAEIHPQPLGSLQVNDTRGTFKDGLKAPIHRWFPYPVGFSPELVKALIEEAKLPEGARFYDPFAGTATSLITARRAGLEAHGSVDLKAPCESPLA